MESLRLLIVGPGRAGMSIAFAARHAGHHIVAVVGRDRRHAGLAADDIGAPPLGLLEQHPSCDLALVAVRDDAIAEVAGALADHPSYPAAVHLSGLRGVDVLASLHDAGVATGSFHPLQTLPTPSAGAARLAGAAVAITAEGDLFGTLSDFAESLGARPFALGDEAKPVYHAAAAAASNFPIAALAMAQDLFASAGVDFALARPLVEAVVANSFEMGPRAALTGPVARGDVATVACQLRAVRESAPEWEAGFVAFVRELARLTGRRELLEDLLGEAP